MPTDIELLNAWCTGDKLAGNTLICRYFETVYRFFRSKLDEDTEDLVQRAFEICTLRRRDLPADGSFRGFLFGVARNLLLDHLRRSYRRGEHDNTHMSSLRDLGNTPSEAMACNEREHMLQEAMRRIPLEQRMLLELAYWEDLSGREIAQALEIGENTVRSRLSRARAALREQLEQLGAAK